MNPVGRLLALTGMAFHEMWISFRLLVIVGLPVLGGMLVVAVPPDLAGATALGGAGFWYAVAAGAAICVASAIAAGTLAHERRRGAVAWMVVRAVPRSAVLTSWFIALGLLLASGVLIGSVGAWLAALSVAESALDPAPFAAAVGATAAASLAFVAAGLVVGTYLPTVPAIVVALGGTALLLAAVIGAPPVGLPLPTEGIGLLAHLDVVSRPVGVAVQSAGAALASAAALLYLGGAGLERSDL
jgi:hypothetical protein